MASVSENPTFKTFQVGVAHYRYLKISKFRLERRIAVYLGIPDESWQFLLLLQKKQSVKFSDDTRGIYG